MARPEQSEVRYRKLNGKYLKEAEALLKKKDYAQASEKLWGACAEMIKAVAAKRGVRLGTHRSLGDFVEKLDKENPRLDLMDAFLQANALHTNFYEDWLPPYAVERGSKAVREMVEKLNRL